MTVISGIILQVKSYYAFVHSLCVYLFYHSNEPSCMQNKMQLKERKLEIDKKILKRFIERKNWEILKNSSRRIRFD